MSLQGYLKNLKNLIDRYIDRYLPSGSEDPKIIHKAIRYSLFSGGKRIRPILAIEAYRVCDARANEILPAACAIEFAHTYSLIHDDLPAMDNDDYRRGKLTLHRVFGEANAILAGDAILTMAFNIISKYFSPKIGLRVIKELSDAIGTKGMVGGQVMDLEFSTGRSRPNRKILDNINRLKTARLFEASTRIGAMVAGVGRKKEEAMARFGANFGMAFQIVDDILDEGSYAKVFGETMSRNNSWELIKKAKDALSCFGKKADRLREMANHILTRKK